MAGDGITLSAEEMRAFSISRDQVKRRREERALRVPRVFNLVCSVLEAEDIVETHPEVLIVSTSRNLSKSQMLKLPTGTVYGPKYGYRQSRRI